MNKKLSDLVKSFGMYSRSRRFWVAHLSILPIMFHNLDIEVKVIATLFDWNEMDEQEICLQHGAMPILADTHKSFVG